MEGSIPFFVDALIEGVLTAKRAARELDLDLPIGFGSVPSSPAVVADFWGALSSAATDELLDAIDFVGHNLYVDVFEDPAPMEDIPQRVEAIVRTLREADLPIVGLGPDVAIRVAENGWPTGVHPFTGVVRSEERQAEVLEATVRRLDLLRAELNISQYTWFGLRDADSTKDDPFHQFGLLRGDYSPKLAFHRFQSLVADLGGA